MAVSDSKVSVDHISRAIIEQLQQDGRRAYAMIGRAVGLSEAAVRQRVQKLTEAGIIQIVAVSDPAQVGFARQAMLGITVTGDARAVAAQLAEINEVDYIVITTGSFDIICEIVVEDDQQLLELINDRIRAIAGITGTESFVYLQLAKQTYNWGTR